MLTALTFLLTMSILVTVHEYGHFQVAKWCGVKVLRFSIGFGKPLWAKQFGKDQTELVIAAVPLGGFVKMLDEREFSDEDPKTSPKVSYSESDLKRAFNRQSIAKRIAIVMAGPIANLLLAVGLYWILFCIGVTGIKPTLGEVAERSPAALAGFTHGETILKIDGKNVASWQEVSWTLMSEALKKGRVVVEAVNANHELHTHQLDLSSVDPEVAAKDILSASGLTIDQPEIPALLGEVAKGTPAEMAGLKTNDLVISINNKKVRKWEDLVDEVRQNPNRTIAIDVLRNKVPLNFSIIPEQVEENGKPIGRIGVGFKIDESIEEKLFVTTHYNITEALFKATEKTWDISAFTLTMLVKMLTGQASLDGVSGPVTIASYAGQSANMGFKVFVSFLAVVSISIGVLNLLPIPVLDGGHLMYYMVEIFTGRAVSDFVLIIGQRIGFFLLGCMMILAFYNDINRLITG